MSRISDELLTLINECEGHLTAEEVFLLAKSKKINVSLASVYRILEKLVDEGKIKKFSIPNGSHVFDKTAAQHEHLVCTICGKVKDIHLKNLKDIIAKEIKVGFNSYDLCLNYICEHCKKNINTN